MTNVHREAFLARQAGPASFRDGLIATPGVPGQRPEPEPTAEEETAEILADPDTLAAIEEGLNDLASGDVVDLVIADTGESDVDLAELTVAELKEMADEEEIEYAASIHKADLIDLIVELS